MQLRKNPTNIFIRRIGRSSIEFKFKLIEIVSEAILTNTEISAMKIYSHFSEYYTKCQLNSSGKPFSWLVLLKLFVPFRFFDFFGHLEPLHFWAYYCQLKIEFRYEIFCA